MIISIDFDGTCVTHAYPDVGDDIGAVPVLLDLQKKGHRLILSTMRSGRLLARAVFWFNENGISLCGLNLNPWQRTWTDSPKVYADLYIDDAGLGIPLVKLSNRSHPYVDWVRARELLVGLGFLDK